MPDKYKRTAIGFQRIDNQPLEADTVFDSIDELTSYVNENIAYNGQVVTAKGNGTNTRGTVYRIDKMGSSWSYSALSDLVDVVNSIGDQTGIKGNKSFDGIFTFANNKPMHFGSSTTYRGSIGYDYSSDIFCISTTKTKIRFYANRAYTDNMSGWGNTTPLFEISNEGLKSTSNFNFSGTSSQMPSQYYHNSRDINYINYFPISNVVGSTDNNSLAYIGFWRGQKNYQYRWTGWEFAPVIDNSSNLGLTTARWATVNCYNLSQSSSSDLRLKENLKSYNCSARVLALGEYKDFDYTDAAIDQFKELPKHSHGFIAQNVQQSIPEAVHNYGNSEYLAIDYQKLYPITVGAVREQIERLSKTNSAILSILGIMKNYSLNDIDKEKLNQVINSLKVEV